MRLFEMMLAWDWREDLVAALLVGAVFGGVGCGVLLFVCCEACVPGRERVVLV